MNDIKKWNQAIKLYKSLKCPTDTIDMINEVLPKQKTWNVILSTRSRGKTTNFLLFALCLYKISGCPAAYLRAREKMVTRKTMKDLCEVVNDYQYNYIGKIFDGKYNHLSYWAGEWRLEYINEDMEVTEKDSNFCLKALSVDKSEMYKSTLNIPNVSMIIFDEFLSRMGYLEDEYSLLCDLISTLVRRRTDIPIYLLGNMVDRYSVYFDELQINDVISEIKLGEHRELQCEETTLHVYMLPTAEGKQKESNLHYFGWKNPKLTAINGLNGIWAMPFYPHPPKGKEYNIVANRYIMKNGKYVVMEMRQYPDLTLVVCRETNSDEYYDEEHICFVDSLNSDNKYRFKFGTTLTDRVFENLYHKGYYRYVTNSIGSLVESFYRDINRRK